MQESTPRRRRRSRWLLVRKWASAVYLLQFKYQLLKANHLLVNALVVLDLDIQAAADLALAL